MVCLITVIPHPKKKKKEKEVREPKNAKYEI